MTSYFRRRRVHNFCLSLPRNGIGIRWRNDRAEVSSGMPGTLIPRVTDASAGGSSEEARQAQRGSRNCGPFPPTEGAIHFGSLRTAEGVAASDGAPGQFKNGRDPWTAERKVSERTVLQLRGRRVRIRSVRCLGPKANANEARASRWACLGITRRKTRNNFLRASYL